MSECGETGPGEQKERYVSPFNKELRELINRHSQEKGSDAPDFILANYLVYCLAIFNVVIWQREKWYGRDPLSKPEPEKGDREIKVIPPTQGSGSCSLPWPDSAWWEG